MMVNLADCVVCRRAVVSPLEVRLPSLVEVGPPEELEDVPMAAAL
jgi:hypothetical protein